MKALWTFGSLLTLALWGCAAPSLHPLYAPESLVQDSGFVGEWVSEGPLATRVVVREGADGRYSGALTVHHIGELKTGLSLELSLTQIDEDRYVDLYLAKPERERLAAHYGFLALPVHQFMMIKREGDTLRVWPFNADWMRRAADENAFACEVLPIGGRDIAVVTADSGSLIGFLREHAHDRGARSAPMIFSRLGHLPVTGLPAAWADTQK